MLTTFVATSFGLVRFALGQYRSMTERFVSFLEDSLRRQEQANERFESALDQLVLQLDDHSKHLARIASRLQVGGEQ